MTQAIKFHQLGGPETLVLEEVAHTAPGPGQVAIRQHWAGVNYIDVYHRSGAYPVSSLPAIPGVEAAGTIEAIGDGVIDLCVGQAVAWAGLPIGGYAQQRVIAAKRVIALPAGVSERTAAAALLRGLTAHMLLHRVWPIGADDTILVHAAAGGLGLILTQWAKRLGATVIGTVGSEAKADAARRAGADGIILHTREDFVASVRRLTDGRGVDVVYDGVGGNTLIRSLDCVRPFGTIVSLGQASGSLPEITLTDLGPRRSIAIARPSVIAYADDQSAYHAAAAVLFDFLANGLKITVGAEFPLAQATEAHRALERSATVGSILLDLS